MGALAKVWSLPIPGPLLSAVLPVTNDNALPTPLVETWIQQLHGRVGPFSL